MENSRAQLNDYFVAELEGLRTRAKEFARENPSIAEELLLNEQNEGESRDPHVEILIQSFAWLTSRLRQNIESESSKLPSILLHQLFPQLISSIPSLAIAECSVNGFASGFDNGYVLSAGQQMEPVKLTGRLSEQHKLRQCKMSTCFDTTLWPLVVSNVSRQAINDYEDILGLYAQAQSIVGFDLVESDEGAAKSLSFKRPMRFYINLVHQEQFKFYDTVAQSFIGAVVRNPAGDVVARLSPSDLTLCGFKDTESLLPKSPSQELGFSLLQDYFCFPEKFMFFELSGLQKVAFEERLTIQLIFSDTLPTSVRLDKSSLKLNCVPIINLFQKTTEPLPLNFKQYRYLLYPNREHYDSYEIVRINQVSSVNKHGERNKLSAFFSLQNDSSVSHAKPNYRWLAQQERSHRRQLAGTETWLSLYDTDFNRDNLVGETIFAETLCSNRNLCESLPNKQQFSVVGSSPVTRVNLLTRPTRHISPPHNKQQLWDILSHLSVYHVSMTDEHLAKDVLCRFLELYANKERPANQRQIDSIEKIESQQDVQPCKQAGWHGYYTGVKFTLTVTERKFDGSSPILFGKVLHQFLALFCHINSFVRLELNLSNGRSYQCPPMSGYQMLV